MKNQQIAIITAGILAAGLMLVAGSGIGSVLAADTQTGFNLGTGTAFSNSFAPPPGTTAGTSGLFTNNQLLVFPNPFGVASSSASDDGDSGSAGGTSADCLVATTNLGTCSFAGN
jgi:hypothetical protein